MIQSEPSREPEALERPIHGTSNQVDLTYVFAAIWALIIGLAMAGGAWLFDLAAFDVLVIGLLGGLGASASVLLFAARARADDSK